LLAADAAAKAVYLNLRAEPYLATLLAGANAIADLRGFEPERAQRLRALTGDSSWRATSVGELAAMSWLSESLTREMVLQRFGGRVMALDFDEMLADLSPSLQRVVDQLGIEAPAGFAAASARSPTLTRYSKAPTEYAYSPVMRAELLAQARRDHAVEIRKGLQFLALLGARHARVAALL
jgi:hypothetical protein